MQKQKEESQSKPNKYKFIIGWALAWVVASQLPIFIDEHIWPLDFVSNAFLYFALLATFQFFWVRRQLGVNLRHWVALALLGLVVAFFSNAIIAAALAIPAAPGVWGPTSITAPDGSFVASVYFIIWMLFWFVPDFFQWFALRKRFRLHGLWPLVIVIAALFSFFILEYGIFTRALFVIVDLSGFALFPDFELLLSVLCIVDWALPPAIMGFVLYYLVCESQAKQAPPA